MLTNGLYRVRIELLGARLLKLIFTWALSPGTISCTANGAFL